MKLIGKNIKKTENAVKVELLEHVQIHPVVHVSHTVPWHDQPRDIGKEVVEPPAPVLMKYGDEMEVEAILDHRRRGRGYQFLTLMKGQPRHDAECRPTRDFVDPDGTTTEALLTYLHENNMTL